MSAFTNACLPVCVYVNGQECVTVCMCVCQPACVCDCVHVCVNLHGCVTACIVCMCQPACVCDCVYCVCQRAWVCDCVYVCIATLTNVSEWRNKLKKKIYVWHIRVFSCPFVLSTCSAWTFHTIMSACIPVYVWIHEWIYVHIYMCIRMTLSECHCYVSMYMCVPACLCISTYTYVHLRAWVYVRLHHACEFIYTRLHVSKSCTSASICCQTKR